MASMESTRTVLENWGAAAAAFTAIGIFLGGSWKYIAKPVWSQFNEVRGFLLDALPTLTSIADQFKPNGGSSLRDVIDRIEITVAKNNSVATVLLQESPDAIFITDANGMCTWVNDTYTQWTGLSAEQALGMGWHAAIALNDRELVFEEWEKAIAHKVNFTGHYKWTNGIVEFPVRCRTKITFGPRGNFAGAIGVVKRLD